MKAADRKLLSMGVVIGAVIAAELAWFLFIGPTGHHPDYTATCSENCDVPWWGSTAAWTCLFTFVLTFSTVLMWWETRRMASGGEEHSRDMKAAIAAAQSSANAANLSAKAAIVQLRAFVGIQAVGLENVGVGLIPRAIITFKNTGLSPAFNVTQTGLMGIDFYPEPQGKPDLGGAVSRESQPLGVGVEIGMPVELPRALQAHHITALQDNTMALYVFGTVSYSDAFGESHSYQLAVYSNAQGGMDEGRMAAFIGDPNLT